MEKQSFLFSGQGAQYAGMGCKLQRYAVGKETFQEANDILGTDIAYLCCSGTEDDLVNTEITQPAIVTCSIAAFRILNGELRAFPSNTPSATAGLSVGEYSALVASGVLSFADALKLVRERGRLMAEAAAASPGVMAAILGLDNAVVESVCEEASYFGVISPANYNCPGQAVISGEKEVIQKALELAQKAGAKICKVLNVSGAFHSPLMRSAESGLREVLNDVSFSKPEIPFITNVTGDYLDDPEEIKEMLAFQLSNPIQWEASMRRMIDDGITNFVEVGPGKVLTGLMRRIYRDAKVSSTDDLMDS